jgi:hypothetical protein
MIYKAAVGLIGILLVVGFLSIVVFKVREVALLAVILLGVVMMVYEYWEQLHEKDAE